LVCKFRFRRWDWSRRLLGLVICDRVAEAWWRSIGESFVPGSRPKPWTEFIIICHGDGYPSSVRNIYRYAFTFEIIIEDRFSCIFVKDLSTQ